MAYFQPSSDPAEEYTRQFPTARQTALPPLQQEYDDNPDGYDDGFDELLEDRYSPEEVLSEEEYPEYSEEELREARRRKYRIAAGFGDFGATLAGVLLILVLVAFLINMLRFVSSDFLQNFSLWATKF